MNTLKKWLFNFTDAFESIEGFLIIRHGLAATSPIIIIGAMALMLSSLPIPAYQDFITSILDGKLVSFLLLIYSCSFDMLSIYMIIFISYKYSSSSHSNNYGEAIVVACISLFSYCALSGDIILGHAPETFNSSQLFSAIICAIFSCKMYYFLKSKKPKEKTTYITLSSNLEFGISISSILPALIIVLISGLINLLITEIFHVQSIQGLFSMYIERLFTHVGNGWAPMFLYSFLVQIMWFFGIHGNNVLESVIQSNYIEVGEHIFSKSFYDTYVNIGGSGVILCLLIALLLVARTSMVRHIAKLGTFPVLFNISEIISLGIPLLFNPIFLLPFIFVPIMNCAIAYFATYIGLVPIINTTVTWTTPVLFSGYYVTGSYAGTILQLVLIILGTLIYIPFVKFYEERLCENATKRAKDLADYMRECEREQKDPALLNRTDELGQTAKILSNELKSAIKNNEIYFVYQPQTDATESCIGCEVLIRWKHPIAGSIYPPLIIQIAKESNLLKKIDTLLLHAACDLIKELENNYRRQVKVSINLTVASIEANDIEDMISKALYRYGVTPSSLWLEVTENEAFGNSTTVTSVLENLQTKGHKLLIDDFGMGHTSLKYLQANKFDVIKIDGSLTQNIAGNHVNQKIIHSLSELGNNLGFDIIAEYVETREQIDTLYRLGCNFYQGYYYSKPLSREDYIKYFEQNATMY